MKTVSKKILAKTQELHNEERLFVECHLETLYGS